MAILNQFSAILLYCDSTHFLLFATEFLAIPGPRFWESCNSRFHATKALRHATEELRGDREIVIEAVSWHGWNLRYATNSIREDAEMIKLALENAAEDESLCVLTVSSFDESLDLQNRPMVNPRTTSRLTRRKCLFFLGSEENTLTFVRLTGQLSQAQPSPKQEACVYVPFSFLYWPEGPESPNLSDTWDKICCSQVASSLIKAAIPSSRLSHCLVIPCT